MAKAKQSLLDAVVGKLKLKSTFASRNKTRINRAIESSIENFQEELEKLDDKSLETIMSLGENSERDTLASVLENYLTIETQKRDINFAIKDLESLKLKLTEEVDLEEESK